MLTLSCITDADNFRSLQHDWRLLYEQCPGATPFNSWQWLFSWWQSYGGNHQLRLLTWRKDNLLVGIAPLYVGREPCAFGVQCSVIRFVGDGSGDSDHLGVLAVPETTPLVNGELAEWLHLNSEWDALALREMPNTSKLAEDFAMQMKHLGYRIRLERSEAAVLQLPRSFEQFLQARQSRFRTKLRALLKKADEVGWSLEMSCEHPQQLRRRLRSLFALHQSRWQHVGGAGVFGDTRKRSFYRRFVPKFARSGWLRLYSLRQENEYVAHQLCFGHSGVTYLLQEAFDVSNPSATYGQMLRAAVIRHLIDIGENRYDFLGGFTQHKEIWGARKTAALHLIVARRNLRGRLYFDAPVLRDRLATVVNAWLPPPIMNLIRRALKSTSTQ